MTVGPDFCGAPAPPVGGDYVGAQGKSGADTHGLSQWWNQFNDPVLVSLLERAERSNYNLEEAAYRIMESRARLGIAGANFRPDVDANGTYRYTKRADNADPFVADNANAFDLYSLGFDAGWEIDLFGRLRRNREVAEAELRASEFDRDDIRITLLAEVASVYVQIRRLQQQIEMSRMSLAVQERSIRLVEEREEAGVSTKLDSQQALAFKFRTQANTRQFEQQLHIALNQLSVLLGSVPSTEIKMLIGHGNIPFPSITGIGIPANVLRSRPDVKRAEAEVAAASAQIGVAVSDLYPQLNLLGTISVNAKSVSDLFTTGSLAFSVGPSLTWNILHFGRICFNIQAQEALMNQKIAAYRQAVIQAVREVEDGLAQHDGEVRRASALRQAVRHDVTAISLALDRYKVGKANYQRVLDSQQQQLQDVLNEAQAQANSAIQMIRVFKSVGGGQGPVFMGGSISDMAGCGCDIGAVVEPTNNVIDYSPAYSAPTMEYETSANQFVHPFSGQMYVPGSPPRGHVQPAASAVQQQFGQFNIPASPQPHGSPDNTTRAAIFSTTGFTPSNTVARASYNVQESIPDNREQNEAASTDRFERRAPERLPMPVQ